MTSLVHAISRPSRLRSHLSAYLAGVGATSALTAGAVVVFLSLATFVAFNGLPSLSGSSDNAGSAYLSLSSNGGGSPTAAAAALKAAHAAVANDPVPRAQWGGGSFGPASGAPGSGGGNSSVGPKSAGDGGSAGPGSPGVTPPTGAAPAVPSAPAPPSGVVPPVPSPSVPSVPDPSGAIDPPRVDPPSVPSPPHVPSVSGAVGGVDRGAGTNLSGPTRGITRTVDGALAGALG